MSLPETDNKAKISASLLIILTLASSLCFFVAINQNIPKKAQDELYIWQEHNIYNDTYNFVWLTSDLTLVNKTTDTVFALYTYQLNKTESTIELNDVEYYVIESTSEQVYSSENSAMAIQWAIDNESKIKLKGQFTLNQTIQVSGVNKTIVGFGAYFTGPASPLFNVHCDNSTFSDLYLKGDW